MTAAKYDYIIVGSGQSGGVLAYNLHKAGAKCLLLEAGRFYRAKTFPYTEFDYSPKLFWGGGLEFNSSGKMAFLRARCVGGTSVVNQCLLDRFDKVAMDEWRQITGIDYFSEEKLDPYYTAVEEKLSLQEIPAKNFNRNTQIYIDGCEKNGFGWAPLRRGQSDCKLDEGNDCIGCLGGCQRDSKQSTLATFIKWAEADGLEIISEFMVEQIEHFNDHVKVHGFKNKEKISLETSKLILAAGCFGTNKIMLNSGFGDKLPALGKNFASHPQYMSFGIFDEPVNAHKGAFQGVKSKDDNFRRQGFKLENVFGQPISIAMLMPITGVEHQRLMKKYRHFACIEVAVRDEAAGEISVDKKGKLIIKKELTSQDKKRRDTGIQAVENIFSSLGAKEMIKSPYYFGLHLMGGCAIGSNPKKSVVNEKFQVHGHPNILIADSSVFPSAPGINPALSIMMLSQKLSEDLVK